MINDFLAHSSKQTAYIWVNWLYMNEKQWGIQTAHCISDMSVMGYGQLLYNQWAKNDKTIIMFNGTNSGTIKKIYSILEYSVKKFKFEIPHVIFREDEESLDGAVTSCGFILPDVIRNTTSELEVPIPTDYLYYKFIKEDNFDLAELNQWMRGQRLA